MKFSKKTKIRFDKYWIILLLLVLFLSISNYYILKEDETPHVWWDQVEYLLLSCKYYDIINKSETNVTDTLSNFYSINYYRPPLFMLSSLPLYFFFGKNPDVAIMINTFYLLILIFSVYYIGKKFGDNVVGLLAVFSLLTFPQIIGLIWVYILDLSLVAMVSLSFCLLIYTNNFENRRYSFLFGISLALGMLTKWTHYIFILGPLIYIIYNLFLNKRGYENNRVRIKNLFFSLIICFVIAGIWYVPHLSKLIPRLFYTVFVLGLSYSPNGFTLESLTYYLLLIPNQIGLFFVLFLSSLFLIFFFKIKKGIKVLLLLWLIIPYIIFSCINGKDIRYTVAYLPAISIMMSLVFCKFKKFNLKLVFITLILMLGIFNYYNTVRYHRPATNALSGDWKTEEILRVIDEDADRKNVNILVLQYMGYISPAMEYASCMKNFDFNIYPKLEHVDLAPPHMFKDSMFKNSDYVSMFKDSDYVIKKEGGDQGMFLDAAEFALKLFEQNIYNFELIKVMKDFPDNSTLLIYKNKNLYKEEYKFLTEDL